MVARKSEWKEHTYTHTHARTKFPKEAGLDGTFRLREHRQARELQRERIKERTRRRLDRREQYR